LCDQSGCCGLLQGSTNRLAEKHIPQVAVRNDTSGGQPMGRRADQVGGLFIVHREDMKLYMHDWLKFTEAVRFDPDVRLFSLFPRGGGVRA
jgi:hypothetical protein